MDRSEAAQRRGGRSAVWVVAAALAVMFLGATLPTPLYPLYRRTFGFSGIMLTLIYAAYVLGNLFALMVLGRLSDQIGRRNAVWPAIVVALASTGAFTAASGTGWLFAARILSGVATGLAAGAATAWIAELQPRGDKAGAAVIASAANLLGLAAGPLFAGLLAEFAPFPLRLSYVIYAAILVATAVALVAAPETVGDPVHGPRALSLRPRFGVPAEMRAQFIPPAATAFGVFALLGFYAALIPGLLAQSLHETAPSVSGAVVCELFLFATATACLSRGLGSGTAMMAGLVLLPPSLALLVAAQLAHSLWILLGASACGGVAAALGYRGSLQVVNEIAPAAQRGEVVSSYLVACYVGNSVPVIGIGVVSALAGALLAHIVFAVVITGFAVAAWVARRRLPA